MSPLRFVALLVFVGFACWMIWPSSAVTTASRGEATVTLPRASYATTTLPSLPTDDGHVSIAVEDSSDLVRIEGVVLDTQKTPIGGATVRFASRTTIAEADGSFELDDVPSGSIVLRAERGEWYGEENSYVTDDSEPIEITVRRGPTLVLHVVRATNGAPVANAKVEIAQRELYTNAAGTLRTRGLDVAGERFTIYADGLGTWRGDVEFDEEQPTAEKTMTVKLSSGAPISGVVVDERGKPVPEAHVSINAVEGDWFDSAIADASGRWTIPAISTGKHGVHASSRVHIQKPEKIIEHDGVRPLTDVVVEVLAGAEIAGRVVDDNGKPVAGASMRGAGGFETDADGRFLATGLEPGELLVSAHLESRSSEEKKVMVVAGKRAEVSFVIRESSLAGRVVDNTGAPIADAYVWARATDESGTYFATTDEYGKFDFGGMPPGHYHLISQHPEEMNRLLPDEPGPVFRTGRRDITIVLPGLATIAGRVILDGAPVAYFGVYITKSPNRVYIERGSTISDERGAFAESNIAPGTWTVVIVGPGFATKTIERVVATEGRTTDLGTIVVDRGRVVRGRVTDQQGRPVAGAQVIVAESMYSIANSRVDQRAHGDATARTDANGRYEIAGLAAGNESQKIVARSGEATSIERLLLPSETEADLVIVEVGRVVGHIANMRGMQIGVVASPADEAPDAYELRHNGDVDRAGSFRITGIPAGRYVIRVMGANTLPEKTVDVAANATTTIDFAMPDVPIEVTIRAKECSLLYLIAPDARTIAVCSDDVTKFDAVEPGTYQVCDGEDACTTIHVAASPPSQRFDIALARPAD